MKSFHYTLVLPASPDRVWRALTSPELVRQSHLAPLCRIEGRPGGAIEYGAEDLIMISGKISEWQPGKRLAHSFRFAPASQSGAENDPESQVLYEIEELASGSRLSLRHEGFARENQSYANIQSGWPPILENLKKLLESGADSGPGTSAGKTQQRST